LILYLAKNDESFLMYTRLLGVKPTCNCIAARNNLRHSIPVYVIDYD